MGPRVRWRIFGNDSIKVCLTSLFSGEGNLNIEQSTDLEAVDLDAPEWSGDINNVTSVLKMWLRDLPDPLLTHTLHQGFLEAASLCLVFSL